VSRSEKRMWFAYPQKNQCEETADVGYKGRNKRGGSEDDWLRQTGDLRSKDRGGGQKKKAKEYVDDLTDQTMRFPHKHA